MDTFTKRDHKANSKLGHAINFILLDQDTTTNRIELRKTVKIGDVIVIRYRGISPKLGSCQGSAHTHMIMSPSLKNKKMV